MASSVRNKVSLTKIKQIAAELRKVYLEDKAVFGEGSFRMRLDILLKRANLNPFTKQTMYTESGDQTTLEFSDGYVYIVVYLDDFIVNSIKVKVVKEYIY